MTDQNQGGHKKSNCKDGNLDYICINGQMIIILSRSAVNISPGDGIEQSRAVLNDQSIWRSGDAQNPNVQSKSFKILQQQLGH